MAALLAVGLSVAMLPVSAESRPTVLEPWSTQSSAPILGATAELADGQPALSGVPADLVAPNTWLLDSFGAVDQIEYSAKHNVLIVWDGGMGVRIIDVESEALVSERPGYYYISDMSLTPSGDYLFVADWGYDLHDAKAFVARYDIAQNVWTRLPVGGSSAPSRIEAVGPNRILLHGGEPEVALTYNSYRLDLGSVPELDSVESVQAFGDIAYDPKTRRVYFGSYWPPELSVFQLDGEQLNPVQTAEVNTGNRFSPDYPGPATTLSSDAKRLFFGKDQIAAGDVVRVEQSYSNLVESASSELAFGDEGQLWAIESGAELARTPFQPTAIHMSRTSADLWFAIADGPILHCEAQGLYVGCPRLASCDGLPPTHWVGINTDGSGTSGDDVILGTAGPDTIDGLGGDDVICGAGGDDSIIGGDGNDRIYGGNGNDTVDGGNGNDRVRGQNGDDRIDGGAGNDNLNGNNGDDTVNGQGGHDYVSGRDGFDLVTGGPGEDQVYGGGKTDTLRGGPGNDTMWGNAWRDRVEGGSGDDVMSGGDGPDHLLGGPGDDQLDGNRGNDILWGGNDTDTCNGRSGWDQQVNCEILIDIP